MSEPRVHGIRSTYHAGCRCLPCRAANADYKRERLTTTGPPIPIDLVRAHLDKLVAAGLGTRQIAYLSGLHRNVIRRLRSRAQTAVRPGTAEAILAIPPALARGARVPAWRTRRMVQILMREGFTLAELARRLGTRSRDPKLRLGRKFVRVKTALRLQKLYNLVTDDGSETGVLL